MTPEETKFQMWLDDNKIDVMMMFIENEAYDQFDDYSRTLFIEQEEEND